jgi:hypothetical protein
MKPRLVLKAAAVVFAVLLLGVYVYDRAGGGVFSRLGWGEASSTNPVRDGIPANAPESFGGTKSAAVFIPPAEEAPSQQPAVESPAPAQAPQQAAQTQGL